MTQTNLVSWHDPAPRGRWLSNGGYCVLLTGAGTGVSLWKDTQLTSWEGDRVEDGEGVFVYLRDLDGPESLRSLGAQPCGLGAEARYSAYAEDGCVVIAHELGEISASMTVCVLPDVDVELRRLVLQNRAGRARRLQLTAVAGVVLNSPAAHAAHPAFSKLFVQTEWIPEANALVARRRPRSAGEVTPLMAMAMPGVDDLRWETNRAAFLGRNRRASSPHACRPGVELSGTVGSVLDPVLALRGTVELAAGARVECDLLLAAGSERGAVLAQLREASASARRAGAVGAAAAAEAARRRELGLTAQRAELFQDLAVGLVYQHPALAAAGPLRRAARGALSLIWAHGLGGHPLAVVLPAADGDVQQEVLAAHAYWRALGLTIDLLIVATDASAAESAAKLAAGRPGVVVRTREQLGNGAFEVALSYASLVADVRLPTLTWGAAGGVAAASPPATPPPPVASSAAAAFHNGIGDFSPDGREYRMQVSGDAEGSRPPLAWVNIVANETAGFLASESGAGYTWSRNSREHRLTPWYNDPIGDPHGEALYVRDESGARGFWSPQPGPAPAVGADYEVRHGLGYSAWRVGVHGIAHEVVQFVPRHDPVKITRLRLTNTTDRTLRLSAFAYARVVLGVTARDSARFVVSERDRGGALIATNRVADEFSDGEMFAAAVGPPGSDVSCTADRAAFLGRGRTPAAPQAVAAAGTALDGATGVGLDPCLALQVRFELAAGATAECLFLLGEAVGRDAVRATVERYGSRAAVEAALADAQRFWTDLVGAVQVRTPVAAIDRMVNGWLLYQVLGCRLWARSALYQSGGAYGFRDQLQDAAALVYARPDLTRSQLALHAAHQFVEGDVLHWWHPPLARGIRTRFSDDLLWLPYVTAYYLGCTGDDGVLEEVVGFLQTRPLADGEDEAYLLPERSSEGASLYEHCARAIDRSLTRGAHGLPLMGTGDWNDGMNRIGREGRGESVWVGFFLYDVLGAFIPLCQRRGDEARAARYREYRQALGVALNDGGWDGAWYRRAYYDDGTPLGSAQNQECRIDAIAQAWAVISGAAPPARARQAMDAAEQQLVDRQAGLIRLLTPPFDRDARDPGYIKGYVPGIRENGGQYTHGAMWVVQAEAMLGRRDRAAAYLEMLSPVSHTASREQLAVYQVEPYVIAADIYGVAPHLGRGGWTWYTGSAGWMYRIALERVLGIRIENGDALLIDPRIPDEWPGYTVELRLHGGATHYEIAVDNPARSASRVASLAVDGQVLDMVDGIARLPLRRDGVRHRVRVALA